MLFLKEVWSLWTAAFDNQTWVDNQMGCKIVQIYLTVHFVLKIPAPHNCGWSLACSEENEKKLNKTHTYIFWQMSYKLFASFLFTNTVFTFNKILKIFLF